jgi:hypothetical protein
MCKLQQAASGPAALHPLINPYKPGWVKGTLVWWLRSPVQDGGELLLQHFTLRPVQFLELAVHIRLRLREVLRLRLVCSLWSRSGEWRRTYTKPHKKQKKKMH